MPTPKRPFLAALLLTLCGWAAPGLAQTGYPAQPVRLVVPYPAGGPVDAIARRYAEQLSRQMGQPFVIDNKAGASGSIGANSVATAKPDGHTLLLTIPDALINVTALLKQLPYDPQKDFVFITQIAASGAVLMANAGVPAANLGELLQLAKAKPGSMAYGSWGPGSYPHVLGHALTQQANVELIHTAYRGALPAIQDMVARQIAFTFGPANVAAQFARSGQAKPLAIAGSRRSPLLPETPTFAELGFGDAAFRLNVWVGLLAPAGTPAAIVQKLQAESQAALKTPELAAFIAAQGFEVLGSTPEAFAADYRREFPLVTGILKSTGIQPE